jgi:DNA-binding response OmpR family regulator
MPTEFMLYFTQTSSMKILIIEDETTLANSMASYLKSDNYTCEIAPDCRTALEKTDLFDYDCILLDISLSDGSGLSILKELKANKKSDGVIIISARNSIHDRIEGLNLGADDYLSKPFYLSELSARIAAVIRRRRFDGNKTLVLNNLIIDMVAKTVFVGNVPVDLTRKEYDLLLYLASNKNRVVSKSAIAERLSGAEAITYDNLDFIYSHMKNLKKKLHLAGGGDYIRSMYGMGYKLEVKS